MTTIALIHPIQIKKLWLFNLGLLAVYLVTSLGIPFLKGSVLEFSGVKPLPFNGAVSPIAFVPNWLNSANSNKTLRFEDISLSEFVALPFYNPDTLQNASTSDKIALLSRGTFITPYMGSYRMNFVEYDGSHLGVDIRAPLGTPVVSIANGVITKVVNSEGADGKYVVIRHDGISYDGSSQDSYYSAYLHLESISVVEGTSVSKGEQIGKVGVTGITTTPHLHFQIDKADAPFHPYWPYTFKDLRELKLDFFEAVNMGLGKENALKYTVHPMEFVQNLESGEDNTGGEIHKNTDLQAPKASESLPAHPQNFISAVTVASPTIEKPVNVALGTSSGLNIGTVVTADAKKTEQNSQNVSSYNSAPILPIVTTEPPIVFSGTRQSSQAVKAANVYIDVAQSAIYRKAAEYLKENAIPELSSEQVFRAKQSMSRREAILYIAGVFHIDAQLGTSSTFADVSKDDPAVGYIASLQARGIIQSGWLFRPNDAITKKELATLLFRIRGDRPDQDTIIREFITETKFSRARLTPDAPVTRSDGARMIHVWATVGMKRG